jgi:hypothetical protein
VRNEELEAMLQSMHDLERTWNHKFNYPWTFFNDKPFSEEFKKKTQAATQAEVRYGMYAMRRMPRCKPANQLSYVQSLCPLNTGTYLHGSILTSTKNP